MKPTAKRTVYKASAFSMLFALFASVLYISSRVTAPDLIPVSAFGAGFLSASAVFWFILRKKDVRRVTEALDRASIGDFSHRIRDVKGVPASLAEAYNRMARRAERRFKALQAQLETMYLEKCSQEGCMDRCAELERMLAETSRKNESVPGPFPDIDSGLSKEGAAGLYNKRQFEQALLRELKSSDRFKRNVSVLLADLDAFHAYGESRGPRAAERLLKGIAATLKGSVREVDAIARQGGDEFMIMLPETSPESALSAAERVRLAVEASCPLTISVGIATFPDDSGDLDGLLAKAEAALETSKKEGRNRTTAAGPLPGPPTWARTA